MSRIDNFIIEKIEENPVLFVSWIVSIVLCIFLFAVDSREQYLNEKYNISKDEINISLKNIDGNNFIFQDGSVYEYNKEFNKFRIILGDKNEQTHKK